MRSPVASSFAFTLSSWGVAALLGALLAACGLPFAWSFLTPLPLAALLALIAAAPSPRAGAGRAFFGGLAFFSLYLLWLPQSFGAAGAFGTFGVLMYLPVFALEGLFLAIMAWTALRLAKPWAARVWLLALGWVLLEWLRSLGPLAFPWGTVGYTLLPLPVSQVADLGGVLLLSLLVTTLAAGLALAARRQFQPLLIVLLAWGGATVYGVTRPEYAGQPGRALLVRTSLNSFAKAQGASLLGATLALSGQARQDEVAVWSETTVGAYTAADLSAQLPRRPILTGVRFPDANGAVAWDGRVRGRYDKVKLVPFGEYSPLSKVLRPLYDWVYARFLHYDFEPIQPGRVFDSLLLNGRHYGVYICYDSVYGGIAAALVRHGARVLVNVSNDGWFGESVGVEQHFQMGRLRAIETRRFVLRGVNDGIAAVIDPRGRVTQRFDGPGEGVVHARFAFRDGLTPYVRFGDVPVVLACLLGVVFVTASARRARAAPSLKRRVR